MKQDGQMEEGNMKRAIRYGKTALELGLKFAAGDQM